MTRTDFTMVSYYLQLLTIGLLWVTIHCAGMCGPIVAGLNAGLTDRADVDSSEKSDGSDSGLLRRGAFNILSYQLGRAITYAIFGALAGLIGASLEAAVLRVGRLAALVAGGLLVIAGLTTFPWVRRAWATSSAPTVFAGMTSRIGQLARRITDLIPASGRARIALFGAVMGFLPCMLMFWVLALAASSANPVTGAGLMVGLVVLTTPVLVVAGTSPMLASGRLKRWSGVIRSTAMILSGAWLMLIGAAHNGWIAHQKFIFKMFDHSFTIMLW